MAVLNGYSDLIRAIPVQNQSSKPAIDRWFGANGLLNLNVQVAELTRQDIFDEINPELKVVKTLLWGYPKGGRGNNIQTLLQPNILQTIANYCEQISQSDLNFTQALECFNYFNSIQQLGISTYTKFLYFFEVRFNGFECLIFDEQVKKSLQKENFVDFHYTPQKGKFNNYLAFLKLMNDKAAEISVTPSQLEVFIFYFNNNYRFD